MTSTHGPLPRDPSPGYGLALPLPFLVAPAVLALRGGDGWPPIVGRAVAGLAGHLVGSLRAFLVLEHSSAARAALGDVLLPMVATLAALLLALLAPAP